MRFFSIPLKHLRFEFLGISMIDSFSSHCVAYYNEPGNKAVGQLKMVEAIPKVRLFWKSETFRLVQSILFSPPFQPQVGVFLHVIYQLELKQSSKVAATTFEILCFPVSSSQMFQFRVLNWLLSSVTKLPAPQGFLT